MNLGERIKKMNLGERIRKTREEKGIKQKDLADKIGISYVMLSQYERGVRTPKYEMVDKIAEALNIDPFYLMYGENNPFKEIIAMQDKLKSPLDDLTKIKSTLDDLAKQAKNDFDIYNNKINLILASLEANKINYEIIKQTEQHKLPLKLKILYQDTDFILDTDDLLYIYEIAQSNFNNSIKNIIDIISTFKREDEEQKQGD